MEQQVSTCQLHDTADLLPLCTCMYGSVQIISPVAGAISQGSAHCDRYELEVM